MTEETENQAESEPPTSPDQGWETWAKAAVGLAIGIVAMWVVVFARFGITSVKVHAAIPYIGAATLVVLAWGLVRTLFNPPVLRRSRTIAFFMLLGAGFIATEPLVPAPLATEDFESKLTYSLPVRGDWMTLAGGRDKARNYHATFPPVRWGFDFTKVVDGKKYALDGKKSADYHCFGQPVFAPVAGKIVQLENHHVDNNPGEVSPSSMIGNHVVIQAGSREFVYLSHLQKGSITVKLDDEVAAGQQIAACGNSGQSPEPHVHMHVQDRPAFPIAQGVPIDFSDYHVERSKSVDRGMPVGATEWNALDGQVVRQRE